MNVTGHFAMAASAYLVSAKLMPDFVLFQQPHLFYLGMFVCLFGALLPDVDTPDSSFGSKVPFISYPLSGIFGHRGITHSLLAIIAIAWTLKTYIFTDNGSTDLYVLFMWPLAIGYLSHLFADLFSYAGVPLFYPLRYKFRIPALSSGVAHVIIYVSSLAMSCHWYFN
ncbi:metal-dependent hydrolase [Vibrio alginolyticus]|uniref:metal-dependent hydrolase n=1 Tax=Vibrio alginolyticus TaxID=663 RepID=UPI0022AA7C35|nr:metal-dependent hydrolase [Vibrio alginolyticus]MCZ2802064.1 metal-dependent hydrolase [Vibrio alginolyticus]